MPITPNMDDLAAFIADHYGRRCPDSESGGPCCDAWAAFDTMNAIVAFALEGEADNA